MTKIILSSFLTMTFTVAGFSQTILRTASVNLNNSPATSLGKYSVEVQIEKNQSGTGITSTVSLQEYGDADIPDHGFYECEDRLSIQGDVKMTYILKDAAGQIVGRQTTTPELSARATQSADGHSVCKAQFPSHVEVSFSKIDDFVDFKIAEGILSVSANFTAFVVGEKSFTASVNENSLIQLRTFLNNTDGKNAPLIDPAQPPVEEPYKDAYCSAHPYDCD